MSRPIDLSVMPSSVPTSHSLFPREHGAYAQLGFPLLTGLAYGGGASLAGVSFALAAVLMFLIHEPVAVLAGIRGNRMVEELAGRAKRRAFVLGVVGGVVGIVALATAPPSVRLVALAPLAGALILGPLAATARLKNLPGELLVVATFAATLFPVAAAGGTPAARWTVAGGVWFVTFAMATIAVHALKARIKQGSRGRGTLPAAYALAVLVLFGAAVLVATGRVPTLAGLAVVPVSLVVVGALLLRVHPRQLRRFGWSLVASNVVTLVLLVL